MNSQCVCDAFGMCPQGCPYCAVCSGDDDSPPDGPESIQAGLEALAVRYMLEDAEAFLAKEAAR